MSGLELMLVTETSVCDLAGSGRGHYTRRRPMSDMLQLVALSQPQPRNITDPNVRHASACRPFPTTTPKHHRPQCPTCFSLSPFPNHNPETSPTPMSDMLQLVALSQPQPRNINDPNVRHASACRLNPTPILPSPDYSTRTEPSYRTYDRELLDQSFHAHRNFYCDPSPGWTRACSPSL